MRNQRTDSSFPFPSRAFGSVAVQTLPAAEIAALVRIWDWAWANECRVPLGDRQAMGLISRLGDDWERSRLHSGQAQYFGEEGLVLALADAWNHRKTWVEKSAEGGRRSGISRRKTKGGSTTLRGRAGLVELPLNHPLKGGSSTLPSEDATPLASPVYRQSGDAPFPSVDSEQTFPPIPPLRETSFQEESLSEGGGGGRGEGDAFSLAPKPSRSAVDAQVELVLDAYMDLVGPMEPANGRARSNVRALLTAGTDQGVLLNAVKNYATNMNDVGRDPQFRKAPHNFFSRKEAVWKQHVDLRVVIGGVSSLACFAEKLRPLCKTAEAWFIEWADRHARRNNWSKPDDPHRMATWWETFFSVGIQPDEAEEASIWLSTKPRIENRVQQRDEIIRRVRVKRTEKARPVTNAPQTHGPSLTGWEYMQSEGRRKMFPREYRADGQLTDQALEKHGYTRDGKEVATSQPRRH